MPTDGQLWNSCVWSVQAKTLKSKGASVVCINTCPPEVFNLFMKKNITSGTKPSGGKSNPDLTDSDYTEEIVVYFFPLILHYEKNEFV